MSHAYCMNVFHISSVERCASFLDLYGIQVMAYDSTTPSAVYFVLFVSNTKFQQHAIRSLYSTFFLVLTLLHIALHLRRKALLLKE